MVVDALRTGLHAAAPMRPANSHVKSAVRTVQSTVSVTTLVNGYAAWSVLNKVNDRSDARFSDVVLIVCPNVTIRDRLRANLTPRGAKRASTGPATWCRKN